MLESCDKSLSSGDESSSISLHSLISASFHSPFAAVAGTSPPSSHHYALNLSPLFRRQSAARFGNVVYGGIHTTCHGNGEIIVGPRLFTHLFSLMPPPPILS
ncbi:hypothetical protein WDU94_006648 [Cyamophila willieti]